MESDSTQSNVHLTSSNRLSSAGPRWAVRRCRRCPSSSPARMRTRALSSPARNMTSSSRYKPTSSRSWVILLLQMTKFTEFEIVTLWNHFKADFPSGLINKTHLAQMIKKTFPRHYRNISRISRTCFIVGVIIPRLSRQTCLGNWFVT